MAAPIVTSKKRDAPTLRFIFARLLARREVGDVARQQIQVVLAPVAPVALGVETDVLPHK